MQVLNRVERDTGNRRGFAVVGQHGAIEFWFHRDDLECAGVEQHSRSGRGNWEGDSPSHQSCELLDGEPCWHDGTSLWASEHWVPGFKRNGAEWVWQELERTYAKWFVEQQEG